MEHSHLHTGRINVGLIHDEARIALLNLLAASEGTKCLVCDDSLAGLLGLIATYSQLSEHNVTHSLTLVPGVAIPPKCEHVLFIVRPRLEHMKTVAGIVKAAAAGRRRLQFRLVFVPRQSLLCIEQLEHLGVLGSLGPVEEFRHGLFPLDADVVSMEVGDGLREHLVHKDPSYLFDTAEALGQLLRLFGPPGRVFAKGYAAQRVWELAGRGGGFEGGEAGVIDDLVLLDRSVDWLAVLLTQLTYEGLIDECFGIETNAVRVPGAEDKVVLNSSDRLFSEIRDLSFSRVGAALARQAHSINSRLGDRHGKSVGELKRLVAQLPALLSDKKSLATHTDVAERIQAEISRSGFAERLEAEQELVSGAALDRPHPLVEACLARHAPLVEVLRLVCLHALTGGSALRGRGLDHYRRELSHAYGPASLAAWRSLEAAGLLRGGRHYSVLRKALRLDVHSADCDDASYVHCLYAPATVRLVERLARDGSWRQLGEVLPLLPGPTLELDLRRPKDSPANNASNANNANNRAVLVVFVGGCTLAEISALRFVSQQDESRAEFLVATTKVVSGNSFMRTLIDL